MSRRVFAAIALAASLLPPPVLAHEIRPAYLELREETPGDFAVLWKTPMRGDLRLALSVELSGRTTALTPVSLRRTSDAAVETWRMRAIDPLGGQQLRIRGLEATMTDALVRLELADGSTWTHRLTPQEPSAHVPVRQRAWSVADVYVRLGIEHILGGVDHLLFVLSLLLVTRGARRLVKTVTAFTVAHSITLGLATLGFVHVPPAPVEAIIALSIVVVAAEVVRGRDGEAGITARAPWIVAFTFGLLHGFGFAGALREVGLPEGQVPFALLSFNVGVEIGQLLFIAALLALVAALRRARWTVPGWAAQAPAYAIGSVAMFWVIQRVAAF